MPVGDTVHIRVEVEGTEREKGFFHWLMGSLDSDWPYGKRMNWPGLHERHKCKKCGGMEYNNPTLDIQDVVNGAKQLGIKMKIRRWGPASKCRTRNCAGEFEVVNMEIKKFPVEVRAASEEGLIQPAKEGLIQVLCEGEGK